MQHSPAFLKLVEAAKVGVKEISIDAMKQRLSEGFILVDVREDSEWSLGRIPGAIHLSKGLIERDIEVKVPQLDQGLILYCGGGYRSILAAHNLQIMGYRKVLSLEGGFRGWTDQNLRVDGTP